MYEIIFYKDRQDNEPLRDYLIELRKEAAKSKDGRIKRNKIVEYITILKTHGTRAGLPYTKYIDGDIWELRPLDDRILFAYWKDNSFVLLHHFHKTTNKTPPQEIDQAKRNLKDWKERNGD